MDENWKFVFTRLDNLEAELSDLRMETWPVCQALREQKGQGSLKEKRRFFKFLDREVIQWLLMLKGKFKGRFPALDVEELRQVLVEEPRLASSEEEFDHLYESPC